MSLQKVCRLCLSMNTPVRALDDGLLRDVYEKLTNISLNTPHRPLVACLLCCSQLRRCYKLTVRSVRADKMLSQILHRGELVTEDSIAMINGNAYQVSDLSFTPIKLITIPSSGYNSMDAMDSNIEEPVQSQLKEEFDMDRPIRVEDLKSEASEEEECVNRAELGNTEDGESVVMINKQDVKREELQEAVDVDNEGWASEQDIDTVVIEDITIEIEKLADDEDGKHDKLDGHENVKVEDMMHEVSEAAEDIKGSESEGAAPAVEYKRTNTQLQDRAPREQNIPEKLKTVKEIELSYNNVYRRRFTTRKYLVNHIRTHAAEKPLECAICQQRFTYKCHLEKHLRIHTKEKPFECVTCQRTFVQKSALNVHIKIHTKEKPFECPTCQRTFTQKSALNVHLRIHINEKPFQCAICQIRFTENSSLKKHFRIHTKEKPFECAICQRRFSRKDALIMHLRTHTKVNPLECAKCQIRFTEKSSLKKHLRIHMKEKTFEYVICQRTFTQKGNLNKHLRIHTKDRPFECVICEVRFTEKGNFNRHLRKIHTK